jgi:hypothetical protein
MHSDCGCAVVQQGTGVWQTQVEQGQWPQKTSLSEMVELQINCVCGGAPHSFLYKCLCLMPRSFIVFLIIPSLSAVWPATFILFLLIQNHLFKHYHCPNFWCLYDSLSLEECNCLWLCLPGELLVCRSGLETWSKTGADMCILYGSVLFCDFRVLGFCLACEFPCHSISLPCLAYLNYMNTDWS